MAPGLETMPREIRDKIFTYAIDVDNGETEYPWQPSKPRLKMYRSLTLVNRQTHAEIQQLYTSSSFSSDGATAPKLFFDNVPDLYDAYAASTASNAPTILREANFKLSRITNIDRKSLPSMLVTFNVEDFIIGLKGFKKTWLRDRYPGFYTVPKRPAYGEKDWLSDEGFEFIDIRGEPDPCTPCPKEVRAIRFPSLGSSLELTNYEWWVTGDAHEVWPEIWDSIVLEGKLKDLEGAFEGFNMGYARMRLQGERGGKDGA